MALARFLGQDLVVALGKLDAGRVLGPWRATRPQDRRRKMRFSPVLYGEDHAHDHAELCLLLEGRCRFSFEHTGCVLQAGDPLGRGREQDPVSGLGCFDPEADREV